MNKETINAALDKKAENARALGLDYEPAQQEFASPGGGYVPAIPAQRQALAEQPAQQEPVDFASLLREAEELVREKPTWKQFIEGTPLSNDIAVWMTVFAQDVARRTSPPAQRTWVGLTDDEKKKFIWLFDDTEKGIFKHFKYMEAIKAKLKEKNNA